MVLARSSRTLRRLHKTTTHVSPSRFHGNTGKFPEDVVILSAVRTPIGAMRGVLSSLTAPQLGQHVVRASIARAGVRPEDVDAVYFGSAVLAGVGQDLARQCAVLAGLPHTTTSCTVSKVCGSGLKALTLAAESIMCDNAAVIVAGGAESVSNAPFLVKRADKEEVTKEKLLDSVQVDGLFDAFDNVHCGHAADHISRKFNITRVEQDDYATLSYKRAIAAQSAGVFAKEIEPVSLKKNGKDEQLTVVRDDEEVRRVRFEKMKTLLPAFDRKEGTVTAANASKNTDGAAACVLSNARKAREQGLKPIARILAFADAAIDPKEFPLVTLYAIRKVLARAHLKIEDISVWEINEAFACSVLATTKALSLDLEKVNLHGGGISLGHPFGMSGTRIVGHLAHILQPGQLGCAAICNAGGGGTSIIVEKL